MVGRVLHKALVVCSFVSGVSFAETTRAAEIQDTPETLRRIVGGEPTPECAWPTAVGFGYCSGTLIHPRVVISAAHCVHEDRASTVYLGPSIDRPAREVAVESCTSYEGFAGRFGEGTDWAFCILEEPVRDVPIIPPLMGCELEELRAEDAKATLVGFGRDDEGSSGRKRAVEVPVRSVGGGEAELGGNGKAGCFGDSGGPAFLQLDDGSWRLFGIVSYALGACGSAEHVSLVSDAIPWLESKTGLDLTPCTDARGTWRPSGDCRDFPVVADEGESNWSRGCVESIRTGLTQTCGEGYDPSNEYPPESTGSEELPEHSGHPSTHEDSGTARLDSEALGGCRLATPARGPALPLSLAMLGLALATRGRRHFRA